MEKEGILNDHAKDILKFDKRFCPGSVLALYWDEDQDSDGLKFESKKGYTLSEIDMILKEERTCKINGFFIYYGVNKNSIFVRMVIRSVGNDEFSLERKFFNLKNFTYVHTIESTEKNLMCFENDFNEEHIGNLERGAIMLNRFGAFENDGEE
jgi:hypothetical protein